MAERRLLVSNLSDSRGCRLETSPNFSTPRAFKSSLEILRNSIESLIGGAQFDFESATDFAIGVLGVINASNKIGPEYSRAESRDAFQARRVAAQYKDIASRVRQLVMTP